MTNIDQVITNGAQSQSDYVAFEKLQYMLEFAKSSTIATILAPILCIPIYMSSIQSWRFNSWFILMTVVVALRIYLIRNIDLKKGVQLNRVESTFLFRRLLPPAMLGISLI